jgi:hypothetical protein
MKRREFLRGLAGSLAVSTLWNARGAEADEAGVRQLIEAHRPSRMKVLPADFRDRVGATHVAGKYHLTDKPFLQEGAEKLLELGTRVGKFWLEPEGAGRSYPFNSQWTKHKTHAELLRSDYYRQLLALPFTTMMFEAGSPVENGWMRPDLPERFYAAVTEEYYQTTRELYTQCRDRAVTLILQHWEGDWLLRGKAGDPWKPPPDNWRTRCEAMQKWLRARQAGVSKGRREFGAGARCRVAHAAEVNRVADQWAGIPTVTEHVLPGVELDLVSYSAYDGMKDGLTMWRCLQEIKRRARTGPLFGPGAVYVGEVGIPENNSPKRITERWDELLGAMLATEVKYIVHWELYCNEFSAEAPKPPVVPVRNAREVRGFWLVKPDGSLSESGRYFQALWQGNTKNLQPIKNQ